MIFFAIAHKLENSVETGAKVDTVLRFLREQTKYDSRQGEGHGALNVAELDPGGEGAGEQEPFDVDLRLLSCTQPVRPQKSNLFCSSNKMWSSSMRNPKDRQ